jgi:hypothetical protein
MSEIGIKESIYNDLIREGYSPLKAMELVKERDKKFMEEFKEEIGRK